MAGPIAAYQERFVAFIDVLGFSSRIRRSVTDSSELAALYDAIRDLRATSVSKLLNEDMFNQPLVDDPSYIDLKITTFSDCIAISTDAKFIDSLFVILKASFLLSETLLQRGIFVRGGIAPGLLLHDGDGNILGPAFLEAYRLESTVADYPRVILSKEMDKYIAHLLASSDFSVSQKVNSRERFDYWTGRDSDGPRSLNLFNELFHYHRMLNAGEPVPAERAQQLASYESVLQKTFMVELLRHQDNPVVYRKIRWLADRFNDALSGKSDPAIAIEKAKAQNSKHVPKW